jgi:hypothetical protein
MQQAKNQQKNLQLRAHPSSVIISYGCSMNTAVLVTSDNSKYILQLITCKVQKFQHLCAVVSLHSQNGIPVTIFLFFFLFGYTEISQHSNAMDDGPGMLGGIIYVEL